MIAETRVALRGLPPRPQLGLASLLIFRSPAVCFREGEALGTHEARLPRQDWRQRQTKDVRVFSNLRHGLREVLENADILVQATLEAH